MSTDIYACLSRTDRKTKNSWLKSIRINNITSVIKTLPVMCMYNLCLSQKPWTWNKQGLRLHLQTMKLDWHPASSSGDVTYICTTVQHRLFRVSWTDSSIFVHRSLKYTLHHNQYSSQVYTCKISLPFICSYAHSHTDNEEYLQHKFLLALTIGKNKSQLLWQQLGLSVQCASKIFNP